MIDISSQFVVRLISSCLSLLFLVGCSSAIDPCDAKHQEMFNRLTPEHQSMVLEHRIENGMHKDAVYLAWGIPETVIEGNRDEDDYKSWVYRDYVTRVTTYPGVVVAQSTVYGAPGGFLPSPHGRNFWQVPSWGVFLSAPAEGVSDCALQE